MKNNVINRGKSPATIYQGGEFQFPLELIFLSQSSYHRFNHYVSKIRPHS